MTSTARVTTDLAGIGRHVGSHLGYTEWRTMTQDQVDRFADVTEDHNYIHVDPKRAASGPFGGTVAHGYLMLALLAPLTMELLRIDGVSTGVNYGLDRLRFPAPVPVGSRFRAGAELAEATDIPGGIQIRLHATIEVDGAPKPSLVADLLYRFYA